MKKYFIVGMLTASMLMPMFAGAQSASDLQAQITALLAQIAALQAQLGQQGGTPVVEWCHTFKRNLGMGDIGDETRSLQKALLKEGFTADMKNGEPLATYKDATAAAVSGFQQKYKDEILTPNGLAYGTGFVGPATRVKLNQLYGCEGKVTVNTIPSPAPTQSSITLLAPNGGEQWQIGQTYQTSFNTNVIGTSPTFSITTYSTGGMGGSDGVYDYPIYPVKSQWNVYSWTIPSNIPTGQYTMKICLSGVCDANDSPFTI